MDQRLAGDADNDALIFNRVELLAHLGRLQEAERQFSLLRQMPGAERPRMSDLYALLGHRAEAIQGIAAGLKSANHAVNFPSGILRLDPLYDGLRGDPEFAKVIAEAQALERGTLKGSRP